MRLNSKRFLAVFRHFCKKYPQQIVLDEKERARGVTSNESDAARALFFSTPLPPSKPENRFAIYPRPTALTGRVVARLLPGAGAARPTGLPRCARPAPQDHGQWRGEQSGIGKGSGKGSNSIDRDALPTATPTGIAKGSPLAARKLESLCKCALRELH